jgi:hypothetical protein
VVLESLWFFSWVNPVGMSLTDNDFKESIAMNKYQSNDESKKIFIINKDGSSEVWPEAVWNAVKTHHAMRGVFLEDSCEVYTLIEAKQRGFIRCAEGGL